MIEYGIGEKGRRDRCGRLVWRSGSKGRRRVILSVSDRIAGRRKKDGRRRKKMERGRKALIEKN